MNFFFVCLLFSLFCLVCQRVSFSFKDFSVKVLISSKYEQSNYNLLQLGYLNCMCMKTHGNHHHHKRVLTSGSSWNLFSKGLKFAGHLVNTVND